MIKNVGETVYMYALRNEKFFVHEGTITKHGTHTCVYFKDTKRTVRLPRKEDFGVIHTKGSSLWLADRDDELAKRIFIEWEENSLAELQELIDRKTKLIDVLKSKEG